MTRFVFVLLCVLAGVVGVRIGLALSPAPVQAPRPAPELIFLPCGEIEPGPDGLRV